MTRGVDSRPLAVALMGPTASGKTDLALALADRFPLGLVSADSALVYRGLDIGSAKPDAATLARYPHALVDVREPDQPFSAGDFRTEALAAMASIHADGRVPLLVGGTGLYFRALTRGLADLPVAQPALREQLAARAAREGWASLHAELAQRDPVAATRIRASDTQRIQRALEVCITTGQAMSALQAQSVQRPPWRLLKLVLLPDDRALLHRRIAQRFDLMLADGFLEEVQHLRTDPRLAGRPDLPALRAVGYRQAWVHLDGETDANGFRQQAIEATRQLAKRQLTWFRSERDAFALDPLAADPRPSVTARVAAFLGRPASV